MHPEENTRQLFRQIANWSIIQHHKKTKWKRMKEIAAKKEIVTIKIRGLF